MQMNIYISRKTEKEWEKNAGSKAPNDIYKLCEDMGWKAENMIVPSLRKNKFKQFINTFIMCGKQWKKIEKIKAVNILYQHPMYWGTVGEFIASKTIKKMKKKGTATIVLINDIDYLRTNLEKISYIKRKILYNSELSILKSASAIICHNAKMKQYLIEQGIKGQKIVELELFDYLCEKKRENKAETDIAVAGNLNPQKCGYIYKLAEQNIHTSISLYGVGIDQNKQKENMLYMGSYTPEKLPQNLNAKFGLIWDGSEVISCGGIFGKYLRYNNPHKLSLYMAAGIPVITWKEAAIADFVKENAVGIVVDDLCNIESIIEKITDEQYRLMKKNAEIIGQKVRDGDYFITALQKAILLCNSKL